MKKFMYTVSGVSLVLMFVFFGLTAGTEKRIFLTFGILR